MSKTKISQYDANPSNNTDIDGINLAEGMAPGLVNNAIRELMSQLKDFQVGSVGDPLTVGGNLAVSGASTLNGTLAVSGAGTFTSNLAVSGTGTFTGAITMSGRLVDALPAGTKMLFQQSTAPVGWVKDATHNNKALRVVTGTVGTGGSVDFTTAFSSKAVSGSIGNTTATNQDAVAGGTVANHTLTLSQIPAHSHRYATNMYPTAGADYFQHRFTGIAGDASPAEYRTFEEGGGGAHNHGFTGSSHNHNQNAHNHTFNGTAINLAVQYVDVIICTKS